MISMVCTIRRSGRPDEFVKKVAQNVAQPMSKSIHILYCLKKGPIIFASSAIFEKSAQSKQPSKRRKFAQSGHPVGDIVTEEKMTSIAAKTDQAINKPRPER
jgi:hypothetical protein